MNSIFNCLFLLLIITLQISLGSTGLKVPANLIVSPDSQKDKSDVKHEVDNIREVINEELPIATHQQLNDTLGVRNKIKEAIEHRMYAKGAAVSDDINVLLKAEKDELELDSLNIGAVQQEQETADVKEEIGDTSIKKDLPNPTIFEIHPDLAEFLHPTNGRVHPYNWISHRWRQEKPPVLKSSTIHTALKLPIFKLKHDFLRNFFARKNN